VQNRWFILLVLFIARTAMALQFQTVASTAPFLIDAFGIDYASIGLLIGLHSLPGIVFAIPGGLLGQQFGAKRVALFGLALMAIGGAAMGASDTFAMAAAGRLVLGIGGVLFNILATKMITDWFAGREIVTAMGVLVSSWPLGIALGLIFFGPLAIAHGWSAVMYLSAICAALALLLVAALYRDPPDTTPRAPSRLVFDLSRREWLLVCIAGAIWALFNVSYIVLVSFAPELFTQRSFSLVDASRIVSLIGWTLIASIPLASVITERLGRPHLTLFASFAIMSATAAMLPFAGDSSFLVWFAALVLVVGVPPSLTMALPAQVLRPHNRATGMGIYYTWYYAAMAFLPGGAGLARDLSGSAAAPTLFAAALTLLCALGILLFHAVQRMTKD